MSYILDALKKSESERNQSDSISLLNYPNQKQIAGVPIWLIMIVTVLVNVSALAVWTYWPTTDTPRNTTAVARSTEKTPPVVNNESKEPEVSTPALPQINEGKPTTVIPFAALKKAERDAFPQVEFSTHVYSEDPEYRVLIANGLRLTEGEMLSDTVKLITISENGAIFLHANRLVEIPVLQDWRIQ